jgi:hypothetical protein
MNKKKSKIALRTLITLSVLMFANAAGTALEWSPEGIMFRPLAANPLEPRVAVMFQPASEKLRLDIGTTIDLAAIGDAGVETRFGVDFFTLTRLRSDGRFKFPVETSDYFFGVNASQRRVYEGWNLLWRARLAHISSHLVDGYTGPRAAFVYSREFLELISAAEFSDWRIYVGGTYLFSTIPDDFGLISPQLGADLMMPLAKNLFLRAGYNLTLAEIAGEFKAVHATDLGLKLGARDAAGIAITFRMYDGPSVHGMFYDQQDSYGAISLEAEF